MKKPQVGFTIVELLIVIVVIAILAAISVVAYTGIQTRAENNKTINGVSAYTKIFAMYAADNGTYPDTNSVYPCLDTSITSGCGRTTGSGGCNFSGLAPYSTAFYNLLTTYASTLPTISSQTMSCSGTEVYRGAYVENNTGNTKNLALYMFLKGDITCPSPLGGAVLATRLQNDATTRCRYTMPTL